MKEHPIEQEWNKRQIENKELLIEALGSEHFAENHAVTAAQYALRAVHGGQFWTQAIRREADVLMVDSLAEQIRKLYGTLPENDLLEEILHRAKMAKL